MDKATGAILDEPEIISRGFVYMRESEELISKLRNITSDCIVRNANIAVHDYNAIKTAVRDELSRAIYQQSKRSPMIIPVINRV